MDLARPVDITGDGGVVKRVTVAGRAGGTPTTGSPPPGSVVKVRFVGRVVDGSVCTATFDSSAQRMERDEPFRAKLGAGTFVQGLELSLAGSDVVIIIKGARLERGPCKDSLLQAAIGLYMAKTTRESIGYPREVSAAPRRPGALHIARSRPAEQVVSIAG